MPFVEEVLRRHSVSIVGMEKNTGKTECLNYIIKRLPLDRMKVAVTSIGIDGESLDQVTSTAKPEITVRKGMYFATSEMHYRQRRLLSELCDVSEQTTALGRVVTARALKEGKVLLSGPSSGNALKRWMRSLNEIGIDLTLVDGALSRLSTASPAISEAMVLSTGAAYSANIRELVAATSYVVELIRLPEYDGAADGDEPSVKVSSFVKPDMDLLRKCRVIEVEGALTDRLVKIVGADRELVVNDFTRIFLSRDSYRAFRRRGGAIKVRMRSDLLALCVNPVSPSGMVLDSDSLCRALSESTGLPVYDIVKNNI